jgi:hypothetical protein
MLRSERNLFGRLASMAAFARPAIASTTILIAAGRIEGC